MTLDDGTQPSAGVDDATLRRLQDALDAGWRRFRAGDEHAAYREFFRRHLRDVGFDASPLRRIVPNPAYHLAAQAIAREFVRELAGAGYATPQVFPGDFARSVEVDRDDLAAREFTMRLWRAGADVGGLAIRFAHRHDDFDLPEPPVLRRID